MNSEIWGGVAEGDGVIDVAAKVVGGVQDQISSADSLLGRILELFGAFWHWIF